MVLNDQSTSCELNFQDEKRRKTEISGTKQQELRGLNQDNELLDLKMHHKESCIPNQDNCSSCHESTIIDLRLRLNRRNQLLDEIRVAYHRDVLKLREILRQIPFPTSDENTGESQPTKLNIAEVLKSIPSIDLRKPGLHIFSPEQCELNIKPCIYCGGTLEIVHRESSKILNLIESCDLLKSKEKKLDGMLNEKEEQLCVLQESLMKEKHKFLKMSNEHNRKILDLEKQVEDRNCLHEKCHSQSERMKDLEGLLKDKEEHEEHLVTTNRENEDKIITIQQMNEELRDTNTELESRIKALHHQVLDLSRKTEEMAKLIMTLEELEQQLMTEVETSKGTLRRQSSTIKQNEHEIQKLQMQLSKVMKERQDTVRELEDQIKNVSNLKRELQEKVAEIEDVKIRNKEALERNYQAECQRAATDKGIIDKMRHKVGVLTTLAASYAQGLYDHCLAQEKMLKLENALPSRIQSHRPHLKNGEGGPENHRHESSLDLILHRLKEGVESTLIPWELLLEDETDRRKVLVNLNNRVQINQQHYDDMVRNLHKKYQRESNNLRKDFTRRIEMDKDQYLEKIQELTKKVQYQDSRIQSLERSSIDLNDGLEKARLSNDELKSSCEQKDICIESLQKDLQELRMQLAYKEANISDLSENLSKCQEENSQYQSEIQSRNETLFQLETCLQKTTQRYRERLEQEERRLATNVNVGVQMKPSVCHAQQQIDFVTAGTSVVNGHSVANRLFGFPAIR